MKKITIDHVLKKNKTRPLKIGIAVVTVGSDTSQYARAIDSLRCYSQIHQYKFFLVSDTEYSRHCQQKNKFFRRHCVVGHLLNSTDYLLFVDADVGVVDPTKKIESFIDPHYDVTLYNRFYNNEIAAGGYILKNTPFAQDFVSGFANYESKLPHVRKNGMDNGGLHAYILEVLFPDRQEEYKICLEIYNKSSNLDWLFTFEACVQTILGIDEGVKNIKILKKGTGWTRDSWLTNSLWSLEKDFMLHGWKMARRRQYTSINLPIQPTHSNNIHWYDPLIGEFDFTTCVPGNESWTYDLNLLAPLDTIQVALDSYWKEINKQKYNQLASIPMKLKWQ